MTIPRDTFKPGECVADANSAEKYRQTKITLKQLNGVKMVVLEVGIDKETGIES